MKDVLQQARECGGIDMLRYTGEPSGIIEMNEARLSAFRDSVLEEAAKKADAERAEFMPQAANNNGSRESDFAFGSVNSAERIAAAIRSRKGKP